jgi:hypothetical protein
LIENQNRLEHLKFVRVYWQLVTLKQVKEEG